MIRVWICDGIKMTVAAHTKSEARACFKRFLKCKGRLPVGLRVRERGKP